MAIQCPTTSSMNDATVEYLELTSKMQMGLLFRLVNYFGAELEAKKLAELHEMVKESLQEIHTKSREYIESKIKNENSGIVSTGT